MVASIQSLVPADVPATKDLGTSAVSPPVKTAALLARVTPTNARRLMPSLSERRMLSNRFLSMATIVPGCRDASKQKHQIVGFIWVGIAALVLGKKDLQYDA